jgi:hypothetical protein
MRGGEPPRAQKPLTQLRLASKLASLRIPLPKGARVWGPKTYSYHSFMM